MPLFVLLFGFFSYLVFFLTFVYAIGFVGNLGVPKGIDSGVEGPIVEAVTGNLLLLSIFALQHSIMARRGFKELWTRLVPPPMERSLYVLLSSAALILLFWQWRPMAQPIWSTEGRMLVIFLTGFFWIGWGTVLVSTFLIDHFELFGVKQSLYHFLERELPGHRFVTPALYRWVRHPIMLGFIIAFWSTPAMSQGHLLFAMVTTTYILIAIQLEERDLLSSFGEEYRSYRDRVSMILPVPRS